MRYNAVNRLVSKYKRLTLNKDNISELFEKLPNRRDIRKSTVNKLYKLLKNGKHFETPLVSNKMNGRHRLLDGNHRIEAIERNLRLFPDRKVEVFLFYYDRLSPDHEKKVYTQWNLGTKQTTNDFVKQYWDDIPIAVRMKDRSRSFPHGVSHIWSTNTIEFKTLVNGYLTKFEENFSGGFASSTALDFIEKAKALRSEDYNLIKQFLTEYIAVFGKPDRKNAHYRQAVFYSLFRIWLDNYKTKNPTAMRKAFLKLRGHERVIYYQTFGGTRDLTIQCRLDLLNVINGRRTKNPFV